MSVSQKKDSEKAVKELGQLSPDVILTDLRMPGKSGFDILNVSKELNPDIPVILITAYANTNCCRGCKTRGI